MPKNNTFITKCMMAPPYIITCQLQNRFWQKVVLSTLHPTSTICHEHDYAILANAQAKLAYADILLPEQTFHFNQKSVMEQSANRCENDKLLEDNYLIHKSAKSPLIHLCSSHKEAKDTGWKM